MSELIQKNDNRATIRWKLLAGASALALTAYISSTALTKAEDADRPTVWIELGGQLEQMQGLSSPITAPFMSATPTPQPYKHGAFDQRPPRYALGEDGKISYQPEDSDWIFSAGIRYGRSHSNRHVHHQTKTPNFQFTFYFAYYHTTIPFSRSFATSAFSDTKATFSETHVITDFQAGKDIGLGFLGSQGSSDIEAGVRIAQFRSRSSVDIRARPEVNIDVNYESFYYGLIVFPVFAPNFYNHILHGDAARSFTGVGPSLSWNGSAVMAGNAQDGEITLDFGINAAVLFGRQKAKTDHQTQTYHNFQTVTGGYNFHAHYSGVSSGNHSTRSRNISVPNIGGFAGLSMKYPNVKMSIGYRYDTFLNAMDTGIDARKTSNLTFNGPYASISVGLGD